MERKAEHDIAKKLKVLNHAKEHGSISKLSLCWYIQLDWIGFIWTIKKPA